MSFNKYRTFKWDLISNAELIGQFDMPKLQAVHDVTPHDLIPFHIAKSYKKPKDSWFHFYEDDYQFERIWNNPSAYLSVFEKFEGGISPDFSMYLTMPRSQQIWNCWRNRTMAYYLQSKGIRIIPNVGWSDEESLSWAFDGIPIGSILSITTQGCMGKQYLAKQSLLNGLHRLVRDKSPEKLIVYGIFPENWIDRFPIPIKVFPTFAQQKWRV